jgi:hypothetical protein
MKEVTTLSYHIIRLRPAQIVLHSNLGVVQAANRESAEDRFRRLLPLDQVPSLTPLMLLWRGDHLSSSDTITVKGANKSCQSIDIQIELRRFGGTLHGNVITVPIVEIDLQTLEPGRYEVSIKVTTLWFREYDHPEKACNAGTEHTSFSFIAI